MQVFVDDFSVERIHVEAPTEIIFLCGGAYGNIGDEAILSMRDAFLKVLKFPAVGSRDVILAEDITRDSGFGEHYQDILEFETDLAQITDLILLFCESEGSFAELGSFSSVEEIAQRILVVIRDRYWQEDSFITLGPLRFLNRRHEASVFVLEDEAVGIVGNSCANISLDNFRDQLDPPLRERLERTREPSTFNADRPGHLIKLIVGLVQEFGALTEDEIAALIEKLGIELARERLRSYLLCAKSVEWLVVERKGFRDFLVAVPDKEAVNFRYLGETLPRNRARRKMDIRKYWKEHDEPRFRAISKITGAEA